MAKLSDVAEAVEAAPSASDVLIERWWEEHFPGTAVARDTEAWNVAYAAKEILKRLLQEKE